MQTTIIREKLHQLIDELEDKKAEAIYTLLAEEQHTELQRRKLILSERERYLKGEGISYSPDEVKKRTINKSNLLQKIRNGIAQSDKDQIISTDEAKEKIKKWLK